MSAHRQPGRGPLAARVVVAAVACAMLIAVVAGAATSAVADSDGMAIVGRLPRGGAGRPMAVDPQRSLGIVNDGESDAKLHLMDLSRLLEVAETPIAQFGADRTQRYGFNPESNLALDTERMRIYVAGSYPEVVTEQTCAVAASTSGPRRGQPVFDYSTTPSGAPSIVEKRMGPMPCTGAQQSPFYGVTGTYDEVHKLLYIGGTAATESWRPQTGFSGAFESLTGGTFKEDRGQPLLLRQVRIGDGPLVPRNDSFAPTAARLELDWELDLRVAGCGRRQFVKGTLFEGFIARSGDDVLAYCWDARPYRGLQQGQQGYLVRIPLIADPARPNVMVPKTRGGGPAQMDPVTKQVTDFVARRIPTLPGDVAPILDPVSGRVMLVTTGSTNGNAVWVFDPKAERFVGVITGGYGDQPDGNTAVGFDSTRGRAYVLTQAGLLIAPIRTDPLPAGLLYPVLVNEKQDPDFVGSNRIAVAPKLGRLFVDRGDHYDVLEDRVPDPPPVVLPDPDALTTQVVEEQGRTDASAGGQALATGAHLVNTGGAPRVVGQNDATCLFAPPNLEPTSDANPEQHDIPSWEIAPALLGSCLPELAVSAGHREAAAAASELEAGTGSGAVARAAAFGFGSTDTGSDGDIRRFSDCGADAPDQANRWGRRWPLPDGASLQGAAGEGEGADPLLSRSGDKDGTGDKRSYENSYNQSRDAFWDGWADQREAGQEQYRGGCNQFQDGVADHGGPDLRAGTRGADGKGFPVPAATCGDFGAMPSAETWPEQSAEQPQVGYPTSSAMCDAATPHAEGTASTGALALPNAVEPQLSVARVWSKVSTLKTADQGEVTVALAVAEGVQIPEAKMAIGQIRSLAVTRAHGHRGTAKADLVRQWCGLTIADQTEPGCVDPDTDAVRDMLADLNAAVLQKIQLSVPDERTTATPGGYQAVVTKHPAQRGGDQAVNDDDSHTVSALQAVVYNDGPKGRSRLVVQLAGVHAESRYGIIELHDVPEGTESGTVEEPLPPPEGGSIGEAVPTADVPASIVTPDTFTPEVFVEEGPFEVQRTFSPQPARRVIPLPPGDGPVRYLRIPVKVLSDAIQLLVQNPPEFALLFVMWALLAAPCYLGLRRRSFARALVA